MAVALLFPGQASQYVGMGRDLYDGCEAAREVFDLANSATGLDIRSTCFEGPEDRLRQTVFTQPAVFSHSVAAYRMLAAAGVAFDFVAGHSVGELAALVAAGVMSVEDGMNLVAVRARAMQSAGESNPGAMAAILGLADDVVADICATQEAGSVTPANYNCPGQVVISGRPENVRAAVAAAEAAGARRAVELPVSGAFHSELMTPAVTALQEALADVAFAKPTVPVLPNVTAEPTDDPDALKELLGRQVVSPVLWRASVQRLAASGVDRAYEVGPGSTLKGLIRRIDRAIEVTAAGTVAEIEESVS